MVKSAKSVRKAVKAAPKKVVATKLRKAKVEKKSSKKKVVIKKTE